MSAIVGAILSLEPNGFECTTRFTVGFLKRLVQAMVKMQGEVTCLEEVGRTEDEDEDESFVSGFRSGWFWAKNVQDCLVDQLLEFMGMRTSPGRLDSTKSRLSRPFS